MPTSIWLLILTSYGLAHADILLTAHADTGINADIELAAYPDMPPADFLGSRVRI